VVELINEPPPTPSPDPRNEPPVANDDFYTLPSSSTSYSIEAEGVLVNDTDCADWTPSRVVQGDICDDTSNPDNFTDNGDEPLRVSSCLNGCWLGDVWLDLDSNGSFTAYYGNTDRYCTATSDIINTYEYQIKDARNAPGTGVIEFTLPPPNDPNQRPNKRNENTIYTIDTANETQAGTSHGENNLSHFFDDPDGDSMTYSLLEVSTDPGRYDDDFTLNVDSNGNWSFEAGSAMVNRDDGRVTTVEITVEADDGQGICESERNTFTIEVIGSDEPDPADTPEPTAVPTNDSGDDDFDLTG
jgi:VCBS repeat-containing protein